MTTTTVLSFIRQACSRLEQTGVSFGHGTTNAFDEAAWLTLWRLGLPLDDLDSVAERKLNPQELQTLNALVEQRISSRLPAAYLTGEAWLQGIAFTVDSRVIVPRSLIAEALADELIDPWLTSPPLRILDLCTGSGCLAVLAALAWPQAQIDACDLDADALAVARLNATRHELQARIRFYEGDGLSAVAGQQYDLILCNPPYVNTAAMHTLPPEYQAEPVLALAGGTDGMDLIRTLLAEAAHAMTEDAILVLEIGNERAHFEAAFPRLEVVWLETQLTTDSVLLTTRQALANVVQNTHPTRFSA